MERYALFAWDQYYPRGGWEDFRGAYETSEAASQAGRESRRDYWQVVDLETLRVVASEWKP